MEPTLNAGTGITAMRLNFFHRQEPAAVPPPAATPVVEAVEVPIEAPASSGGFLTYAMQLDAQKHIKGYKLQWRSASADAAPDISSDFRSLLACVATNLNSSKAGWRLGRLVIYLDASADSLRQGQLLALPPKNVVLCLRLPQLMDEDLRPALSALHDKGFGLMLCDEEALPDPIQAPEAAAALSLITHLDVLDGRKALVDGARQSRGPGKPPIQPIATRIANWAAFDACAARRIDAFVHGQEAMAAVKGPKVALQPESVLIISVMQMIQRNEDVRSIEAALAHDTALTTRLLHHINTLAMGHGVEVQSLRHAVALLGYTPLFRWLSLLLATSNKPNLAYMTKKAILRGRFVELTGQGLMPPEEANNLFLAGMFSLIDRVLGVPIEEVLAKVQLPEAVQEAIRTRGGAYGPLVALAESCETDAAEAPALAASQGLSAEKVNAAHLSALAWAADVNPSEAAY
ncbi:EAL and HDOD domain-containing protein [Variovorax sp. ZT4R33]|uniref:EAL and HDOD domain-containing protein n=1 Tax=Variovorax sp. ZT4R33 TaxID=3443743 RepID=UPI003F46648B